jgi:pimeloyl-ACP methyl ester carboxylesterase
VVTSTGLYPVGNDKQLNSAVPDAERVICPGAGHAFSFRDGSAFVGRVEAFLGGAGD